MILTHGANSLPTGGLPPVPPDITLYENLILSTYYTSYNDNSQISVPVGIVNTNKTIALDFTTTGMVYQNDWILFSSTETNPIFRFRLSYNYTNTAYFGVNYGNSTETFKSFNNLTRVNNRQFVGVKNSVLYDMNTSSQIFSGISYVSDKTIGTLKFGNRWIAANGLTYHRFYIKDDNDSILMDLRPAKKGDVIGLYDMITSQFYGSGNSSYWTVNNDARIGGKWYKTCKIGEQTWLAQNLDYAFSGITFGSGQNWTGSYDPKCVYPGDSDTEPVAGYGLVYNGQAIFLLNKNRATLCPGWHVPTIAEWNTMIAYVGSNSAYKLRSTTGWSDNNGTDDYGFSALPAGSQGYAGGSGYWWPLPNSQTQTTNNYKRIRDTDTSVTQNSGNMREGYSVRLVKDS